MDLARPSSPERPTRRAVARRWRQPFGLAVLAVALALPLAGLVFLLRQDFAQLQWPGPALHFTLFLIVGATAASLSLVAGEAARRRGDARVMLLSLAFLATGGFMALHALGTQHMLTNASLPGFTVAISVGLLVAAPFALAAALVDLTPTAGIVAMRARPWLRGFVVLALLVWGIWAMGNWPPIDSVTGEGLSGVVFALSAGLGAAVYAVAAARLWWVHRHRLGLLVLSIVACYVLLAEALIGVTLAGERKWHASWWIWHALIVTAYLLVFLAAHREWREERFRPLYLPATREHRGEVSVLVGDLEGFTSFSEARDPAEVALMLRTYYGVAAPLIFRRFGGEVEKFAGDAIFATFNRRGDQPDHALRAVRAAVSLQEEVSRIRADHPDWPGLRVGVNSGPVIVSEMGGSGYLVYAAVGDTVNVAARLEAAAPVGGILIGERTRALLPDDMPVVRMPALSVKGKTATVGAYLLQPRQDTAGVASRTAADPIHLRSRL